MKLVRSFLLSALLLVAGIAADVEKESTGRSFLRANHHVHSGTRQLASRTCGIPRFIGSWVKNVVTYPIGCSEAHGAIIGSDFVVISGFHDGLGGITNATTRNWARDARTPETAWFPIDPLPTAYGITHAAFIVVGTKIYMCGGYKGGHPGPAISDCLQYDHSQPAGSQWSIMPSLPGDRAGGAMTYDQAANVLIFSGGAHRPTAGKAYAVDHTDTWILNLTNNGGDGWQPRANIPFYANHMAFATILDAEGVEHQFYVAGQVGENEKTGNVNQNWEYLVATDRWVQHASLPITRGHAGAATRALGCGLFQVAGTTNGGEIGGAWGNLTAGSTKDISFYDFTTDSWTKLGDLTNPVKTPVCVVSPEGPDGQWLYCETGWSGARFSVRRRIELV